MMPRLGQKYDLEVEVTSKPPAEYNTDEYFELELPVAPAIMVEDEILVEGSDVSEEKLENAIRAKLGLEPIVAEKKGVLGKLFGR
ncbi:MAG: hypothetical protein HY892_10430 [Deltaproteobacteria bacterium]|nr:hypothetical protein [Deltaproteobacteria bacterium]